MFSAENQRCLVFGSARVVPCHQFCSDLSAQPGGGECLVKRHHLKSKAMVYAPPGLRGVAA